MLRRVHHNKLTGSLESYSKMTKLRYLCVGAGFKVLVWADRNGIQPETIYLVGEIITRRDPSGVVA